MKTNTVALYLLFPPGIAVAIGLMCALDRYVSPSKETQYGFQRRMKRMEEDDISSLRGRFIGGCCVGYMVGLGLCFHVTRKPKQAPKAEEPA